MSGETPDIGSIQEEGQTDPAEVAKPCFDRLLDLAFDDNGHGSNLPPKAQGMAREVEESPSFSLQDLVALDEEDEVDNVPSIRLMSQIDPSDGQDGADPAAGSNQDVDMNAVGDRSEYAKDKDIEVGDKWLEEILEKGQKEEGGGDPKLAPKPKPKRKRSFNQAMENKTPIQSLNEMFPEPFAVRFVEKGREGPPHAPVYLISCHVRDQVFPGEGRSKQFARHDASKNALDYFLAIKRGDRSFDSHQVPPVSASFRDNRYPHHNNHSGQPPPRALLPSPGAHPRHPPPPHMYYDMYHDDCGPPLPRRPSHPGCYGGQAWNFHEDSFGPSRTEYEDYPPPRPPPLLPSPGPPQLRFRAPIPRPMGPFGFGSAPRLMGYRPFGSEGSARPPLLPHPRALGPGPCRPPPVNVRYPSREQGGWRQDPSPGNARSDFAADDLEKSDDFVTFNDMKIEVNRVEKTDHPTEAKQMKKKERIMLKVMSDDSVVQEHPVSLIHELHPDLKWEFMGTESQGKTIIEFKMKLIINEQSFVGEGKTKKLSRAAAAKAALSELYNILIPDYLPINDHSQKGPKPKAYLVQAEESLMLKQDIANRIGAAVLTKSEEIFGALTETKKWNVLAAIVLTSDEDTDLLDIVCLTSGTKCVKGDNLSMMGSAVNDCHAEVLARRCFQLYLYDQINQLIDNGFEDNGQLIVERREDMFGFMLKKHIKVNLFISTAPCGDGRVFSPKEENENDLHPNRLSRGLLRAKIEGGEGTIPVKRDASTLTWDGILQGQQRLQFMSCSDKIAIWNVTGLQGALLSHLLEPVYFDSVVLASLFNFEHLVRAIQGRINLNFESDSLKGLPQMYRVNKPKVAKALLSGNQMQRQLTKTPNYAINWIKGDEKSEVISCDSGKTHGEGSISRLTKRTFFGHFRALLGRNAPTLPSCTLGPTIPIVYREGKTGAQCYQSAKMQVIQAFQEQNLGTWIQVPSEMDLFDLS